MMRLTPIIFSAVAAIALTSVAVHAQDVEAGQKSFNKCRACHSVGEAAKNSVGPMLNGLFGRKAGTIDGFTYSKANRESGVVWDEKVFAEYIKNPREFMPGNQMTFIGIKSDKEIQDLIAFLKQYGADGKKK